MHDAPYRYTTDNLKKRKHLQNDPRLLQSVERWWKTFRVQNELPKAEFVALNCRLYKARTHAPATLASS